MNKISILGVNFDNITNTQALEKLEEFVESDGFHYIVTPNPEFLLEARRDKHFKEILNNADLSIADGTGIIFAAKYLRKKLKEKIQGTDLVTNFMPIAAQKGYKIYFLGGQPGIAEIAKKILETQYPDIKIVGAKCGPFFKESDLKNPDHFEETIQNINRSKADLLIVGFGAPKQEKFIYRFKNQLHVKAAIGVGGAIDYISCITPRAPLIMRNLGLEWLYRLFTQPKRLKRIFNAVIIFPILVILKGKK